ncbi:MAG TPA: LAGLIDADG family homing endonuclease, partial [Nitrososphaerales archaeon]|nr:LAGLIDADG family homing endonuclease [Nitrososphaerales archaeon]
MCEGEPLFALIDGKPTLTTMDGLFESLARKYQTVRTEDGWETVELTRANVRILSLDKKRDELAWTRPFAMARSVHKGDVLRVTTLRNRTISATPGHSFIVDGREVKARHLQVGSLIPIVRHIPATGLAPLTQIVLADYLPGARVTERGVVMGGRESIQIPAPAVVALDEKFAWFLGFFVAEGYVGKGFASIYNKDRALIDRAVASADALGLSTSLRVQRGLTELRVFSKAFVALLSSVTVSRRVGTGKGSQARYKKVPDFVFAMADEGKVAFLNGFYEGDGGEEGSGVVLATSSRELANGLVLLCEQLGIFPTLRVRGKNVKSYSVAIGRAGAALLGIELSTPTPMGTDNG